jgi:hypothetical protein
MESGKSDHGITLVALVISIIVMIMLATVSLNMTIGENGILTQAQDAKLKQEEADIETEVMSGIASLDTEYYQKATADTGITIDSIYNMSSLAKYVNGKINGFNYNKNGTSVVYFTNKTGSYTVKFDKEGNAKTYKGIYVNKYDTIQISMDKNDTIDLSTDDEDIIWIDVSNEVPLDNNNFTKNNNGTVIIKGFKNKGKDNEELVATVIIKDNGVQGNETVDTSNESKVVKSVSVGSNATAYLVKSDNEKYTLDIKGSGKINDGALTVTASDEAKYENIEKIVIEDGIKEIGGMNFVNYKNVTEVVLPESIEKIAGGAFIGMTKLETLYYNSKNAVIKPTYKLEDGKIYIVSNFNGTKLKTIVLGNNVEKIGERAFWGTTNLKNVIFSNSISEIEKQAFYCCINVKTIYLGNKITKIGEEAFSSCSLESITIPENVTSIGTKAFFNCTNLKKLTYNAIECEYDGINGSSLAGMAMNCPIENLIIGEKVKKIPNAIFAVLNNLKEVNIPNSVNFIYTAAFYGCENLTDVKIGNYVFGINSQAFQNTGIKEITIPESVILMGYSVFKDCKNLETVNYNAIALNASIVSGKNILQEFPDTIKNVNIGNKVKYIGKYLFAYYQDLTEINISDSVERVEFAAFFMDKNVTKLTLGKNLNKIGEKAFFGLGITEVTIPENVTSIVANAFVSNTLNTVNYNAIYARTDCVFDKTLYSIFSSSVTKIIIGPKVELLDDFIFSETSITSITIPENVTSILATYGPFAFCKSLTEIRVDKPRDSIKGAPWANGATGINVIWKE